jgi:hypothetical protein
VPSRRRITLSATGLWTVEQDLKDGSASASAAAALPLPKPSVKREEVTAMTATYVNFDVAIEQGPSGQVTRVLASPAGEGSAPFALPFAQHELDNLVLRLGVPRHTRRLVGARESIAKQLGKGLFAALFAGEVGDVLRRSLDAAQSNDAGLRLRLRLSDAPALVDVPWEYLYDEQRDQFLALSNLTPIVRYLDQPGRPNRVGQDGALRVLVVIPALDDAKTAFEPLDVDDEWEHVQRAMSGLVTAGRVVLERLAPATMASLQSELRRTAYDVFHFVGHGGYDAGHQDGMLLFADDAGNDEMVGAEQLAVLLNDHRSLQLAFVNACDGGKTSPDQLYTGTAQRLVLNGLPAVLAMQFPISDGAAIVLAQRFYEAVADGLAVDAALCEARKAIFADGNDAEWATPVLYVRTDDTRLVDAPHPTTATTTAAPPSVGASCTRLAGAGNRREEIAAIVTKWLRLQGCAVATTCQPLVTTIHGVIGDRAVRVVLASAMGDLTSEVVDVAWTAPTPHDLTGWSITGRPRAIEVVAAGAADLLTSLLANESAPATLPPPAAPTAAPTIALPTAPTSNVGLDQADVAPAADLGALRHDDEVTDRFFDETFG